MAEVLFTIVIIGFLLMAAVNFFNVRSHSSNQDSFHGAVLKSLLGLEPDKSNPSDSRVFLENFRDKFQTPTQDNHLNERVITSGRTTTSKNQGQQSGRSKNKTTDHHLQNESTPYDNLVEKLHEKAKHGTPAVKNAAIENLKYMEKKYQNDHSEPKELASHRNGTDDSDSLVGQTLKRKTRNMKDPYNIRDYTNNVSSKKLQQAMIMKEILDKPKSLR